MNIELLDETAQKLLSLVPLTNIGFLVFGISFFLIALVFIIIFKSNIAKAKFFTKLGLFSLVTLSLGLALCAFSPIIGIYIVAFSLIIFIMSVFISFITLILNKISDIFIIIALIALFIALVAQLFAFILVRNIAVIIIVLCIAIKTCIYIFKKETPEDIIIDNNHHSNDSANYSGINNQNKSEPSMNKQPINNSSIDNSPKNNSSTNNNTQNINSETTL